MAALCDYIVTNPKYHCKEIEHKFLVSGHTYLACDQDFGLIEKQKKYHPEVYVPDDWLQVILAARKPPFIVKKMEKDDFFSFDPLLNNITNRKVQEVVSRVNNQVVKQKHKVQWLKMQWLRFTFSEPLTMYYKYSNTEEVPFFNVNLKKRKTCDVRSLDLLYPRRQKN